MAPKTAVSPNAVAQVVGEAPGLLAKLAGAYRNTATDGMITASIKDGGLAFNGGQPFRPVDATHLKNGAGNRMVSVIDFAPVRLDLTRVGNSIVHLEGVADWTPSADQLDRYVGDYLSEEIEAGISIRRVGDGLEGVYATGGRWRLAPLYKDVFDAPDSHWTLRFERDDRGQITGVAITSTRTRRVEFIKRSARQIP